jgi:hypothetical protein
MAETGKSKGSCRLLAPTLTEREYALRPTIVPLRCDAPSVKNASASMPPLSHKEIHHNYKALLGFDPALSYWKMHTRSHHLHLRFAMHHGRPISVSFLDRWRGRESQEWEGVTIAAREGAYDLGYYPISQPEGFRQTCTSPSLPGLPVVRRVSFQACSRLKSNRQFIRRSKQYSKRALQEILLPRISPDPRN